MRRSNWETRSLMLLGNFNMANAPELAAALVERGQHPVFGTDTQTVLEEIGFYLDQAHQKIYRRSRKKGIDGTEIPKLISDRLHMPRLLRKAAKVLGWRLRHRRRRRQRRRLRHARPQRHPPRVLLRERRVRRRRLRARAADDGVRPRSGGYPGGAPGHVVAVKNSGASVVERFADERPHTPCSFERIYFSRGNDPEIYRERKELGRKLAPAILKAIDYDLKDTVFSFIPNTAEIAYGGMMGGLREHRRAKVKEAIEQAMANGGLSDEEIDELVIHNWPRGEKIAHKDIKMRTFISQEKGRKKLVSHVYDISYGVVEPGQSLVVIDDSIVRGTTLRESILKILARTNPVKIVVVSSCPQIRYPDCYGIDMSELGKFIAFQAAIDLLKNSGRAATIARVYEDCRAELKKPAAEMRNCVRDIYEPFSPHEISAQIARLRLPAGYPLERPGRSHLSEHRLPQSGARRKLRRLVLHRHLPDPIRDRRRQPRLRAVLRGHRGAALRPRPLNCVPVPPPMPQPTKIIVVGKGGREHALVTALAESASAPDVYCYPGSDAILETAKALPGEISDVDRSSPRWSARASTSVSAARSPGWRKALPTGRAPPASRLGDRCRPPPNSRPARSSPRSSWCATASPRRLRHRRQRRRGPGRDHRLPDGF